MILLVASPVEKRSVVVAGRKTSISLEAAFWRHLRRIARERGSTIGDLVGVVDRERAAKNLSAHLRLLVLADLEVRAGAAVAPRPLPVLDRARVQP